MEKLLNNITATILKYREDDLKLSGTLSVMLKDLTADLFLLEKYRDEAAKKYNAIVYNRIKERDSNAKAEILAKEQCPELYQLRRFMTAAYKVADALRSNISTLNREK